MDSEVNIEEKIEVIREELPDEYKAIEIIVRILDKDNLKENEN